MSCLFAGVGRQIRDEIYWWPELEAMHRRQRPDLWERIDRLPELIDSRGVEGLRPSE